MYSPNLFSSDLYGLWSNDHQTALNLMSSQKRNHITNTHNSHNNHSNNNNDNVEDINKQMRSLFAPPLSAYSAEYTGASFTQLENNIRAGSHSSLPSMSLTVHRKLDRAHKIRTYGYSTIRPIGINKTLEQLEYEKARRSNMSELTDEHSFVPTAENSTSNAQDSFINGTRDHMGNDEAEVDLDANIPNADSNDGEEEFEDYDEFEDEDESEDLDDNPINEDDGFMAEDVEYQDDHSISTDMNMLINSSTFPNPITASNTSRSLNTIASIPSSVNVVGDNSSNLFAIRRGQITAEDDESQQNSYDSENDENDENGENYSDLDMVIDEN